MHRCWDGICGSNSGISCHMHRCKSRWSAIDEPCIAVTRGRGHVSLSQWFLWISFRLLLDVACSSPQVPMQKDTSARKGCYLPDHVLWVICPPSLGGLYIIFLQMVDVIMPIILVLTQRIKSYLEAVVQRFLERAFSVASFRTARGKCSKQRTISS